jgi:AcrR family transcriptional regulator
MSELPESEGGGVTRREEIFAVAADIFWEKGYHATSMANIADAIGIRKASLYHHIANKEALLYEMSMSSMHHIIEAVVAAPPSDPETRLADMMRRHIRTLLTDRSRHATMLVELRSLPAPERRRVVELRARYETIFDEAIRAVQSTTGRWPGVPIPQIRMGILGMLNWTVFWFSTDGPGTPEEVGNSVVSVVLPPGVSTREAKASLGRESPPDGISDRGD